MVISLADARIATETGEWRRILGISPTAGLTEVRKTRRALQRLAHTDKGGDGELSRLINMAAHELEEILGLDAFIRRMQQDAEDERRAREERMRAEEAERFRREGEERIRRIRAERTQSNRLMTLTVHERTRNKLTLGEHAGRAFPVVFQWVAQLQSKRKVLQARVLIYAAETEIAARRAAREDVAEDSWPGQALPRTRSGAGWFEKGLRQGLPAPALPAQPRHAARTRAAYRPASFEQGLDAVSGNADTDARRHGEACVKTKRGSKGQ